MGKAADLARVPRVDFEWLLAEMGIPVVQYDLVDYQKDRRGITETERRSSR